MLQLRIRFKDSLSNRFLDDDGLPLFKSLAGLKEDVQAVTPGAISIPDGTVWREDYVRKLNKHFTSMLYRVPASYDQTVLGVIARLMGEVRRLERLEEDHPARRFMAASTYRMEVEEESDATFTCMTTRDVIVQQSGGSGVVRGDHPLYDHGPLAQALFGHLGQTLAVVVKGSLAGSPWTPASPYELVARLTELDTEQSRLRRTKSPEYEDMIRLIREQWMPVLQQGGIDFDEDPARWYWAGASVIVALRTLSPELIDGLVRRSGISRSGNVTGIAGSGRVGFVTIKDVYKGAGAGSLLSLRMPYGLFVKKGIETSMVMGAIAKSGYVDVECQGGAALRTETLRLIEDAAVGPFTFGKKGIAYLEYIKEL